jgi:V/A-type H+-transporting ATPase subunit D
MSGAASRSRLLELSAQLEAAVFGRDVMERKRELLLFELRRRTAQLDDERRRALPLLTAARARIAAARVELGSAALDAAVLAQPESASVELSTGSILGAPVPRLTAPRAAFHPAYGPASTASSLDEAGAAFTALLPDLARLAELGATVLALRRALHKTARRQSALERVLIPSYRAELHAVESALEEDERDEAVRRKAWLGAKESAI